MDLARELASEKRVESAELALAWLLAQEDDIVPIPGTKRRAYVEQNVAAGEIELNDDDPRRFDEMPRGDRPRS